MRRRAAGLLSHTALARNFEAGGSARRSVPGAVTNDAKLTSSSRSVDIRDTGGVFRVGVHNVENHVLEDCSRRRS